jgi:hypothetical protein
VGAIFVVIDGAARVFVTSVPLLAVRVTLARQARAYVTWAGENAVRVTKTRVGDPLATGLTRPTPLPAIPSPHRTTRSPDGGPKAP